MNPVPSNEAHRDSEATSEKKKSSAVVTVVAEEPSRFNFDFSNIKCERPTRDSCYNAYTNNFIVGSLTYIIFYGFYLFHFIAWFIFVAETAFPESDFCSGVNRDETSNTTPSPTSMINSNITTTPSPTGAPTVTGTNGIKSYETECLSGNGDLCDWNEFTNDNGVNADYCDASSIYTAYQISLLLYFSVVMIFWELLSTLACAVTIFSLDRISTYAPRANITPFAFGVFSTPGGPDDENGGNGKNKNNNNNNNEDNNHNNNIDRNRRKAINNGHFRIRYVWAYNIFLPFKWGILMGVSKCTKFESWRYSLLASKSFDKFNLIFDWGCKVLLNCAFAIWWISINDNNRDIDTPTLCVFISSGLLVFQSFWELAVIQTWKRKIYLLSS